MNAESTARSRAEVVDELAKWTVGLGVISFALFPLALPILILTAVAVLPLLLPALAVGLLIGVVAVPILAVRSLRRRAIRARRSKDERALDRGFAIGNARSGDSQAS
jgi:Flp pilus assembly protein TadB